MKCIINTSFKKKLRNLKGLDGRLRGLFVAASPILPTSPDEIGCPEFWHIFGLGFLAGFQMFQIKEAKRHLGDASKCISDVKAVQAQTGIELDATMIRADYWFEVSHPTTKKRPSGKEEGTE